MKKLAIIALIGLSSCATPQTLLRHPQTGQMAACGGSSAGSMAGGMIGYEIQKSNDRDCVSNYLAQGFERQPAAAQN